MDNTIQRGTKKKVFETRDLVKISMLSGVSIVLMMFEFAIPIFPGFLKMDLSDLPSLIGAVSIGPMAGILIELIKNILHLTRTSTAGVGEVANFIVGIALVVPIAYFYKKDRTLRGFAVGAVVGTITMVIVASVFNYYILIPAFAAAFGTDIQAFADIANQVNSAVVDFKTLIIFSIAPFNAIKAVIVSIVGYIVCRLLKDII